MDDLLYIRLKDKTVYKADFVHIVTDTNNNTRIVFDELENKHHIDIQAKLVQVITITP